MPQAWAHRAGLVKLQENGTRLVHDAPQDWLAIMEAFARWCIAYDEGQTHVIATLFTDDASYMVTEGSSAAQVSLLGRDAIVAGVTRALLQKGD
ncbi:hypothetical protein IP81_06650 [Novosphingobium sp. AAP83]|uniref:nuclear transport factor 2 family protein n=1 Tax=Novosphingobium sp. AAP83 TaxID=1523425 RepID=UPI0006B94877|nr:nuclear transport factor 2 family protein [Novosphingobium sp. AAP83]KPF92395.1 hypothetical protein IP81_06650 [Novosphingobium sp. AAP83]